MTGRPLDGLEFAVMALGSTVYPNFCEAGVEIDRQLERLGGTRVVPLAKGDEIKGQVATFRKWLDQAAQLVGDDTATTAVDAKMRSVLDPAGAARASPGRGRRERPRRR